MSIANIDETQPVRRVKLSDLFQPGKDTLVVYSYMYGPEMAKPCSSCTAILDGLDGTAPHATQRKDGIHHFYCTELLFGPKEKGMDPRHVDLVWPLWSQGTTFSTKMRIFNEMTCRLG